MYCEQTAQRTGGATEAPQASLYPGFPIELQYNLGKITSPCCNHEWNSLHWAD